MGNDTNDSKRSFTNIETVYSTIAEMSIYTDNLIFLRVILSNSNTFL